VNVYISGSLVRTTATFVNISGANTDPTTITLKIKQDAGSVTTLTYAGAQVSKSSTGVYYYDIDTTGWTGSNNSLYTLEWVGTGSCQAINVDAFEVQKAAL
jgi:hypothetical protein